MSLLPLEIPPGFVKTKSANAAKGRYTDGDKVRFVNGRPEKWRGWEKLIDDELTGVARGAIAWVNQFGVTNVAIGTHKKLYAIKGADNLDDITPIAVTGTLTDPFSTTSGSAVVTVADEDHAREEGDFVHFDGADAVGGITIDGEYEVTAKVDTDSYTITHSSAATSTVSGGGGSVDFEYEISIGNAGTVIGLGWGAGAWGEGTWGTSRETGIALELRHWSLQEYGNDLLASPSGGGLYLWEEASDERAEVVTNAPTAIRAMFVTGEGFIFALGTTTPMTVQWPDRDDATDWTATASNTANSRALQNGSKLMAGTALADLVNLVWSNTALYAFQYTGSEFVYDSRLAGTNCGLIGPLAFTTVSGTAYWMSAQGFHQYSGGVSPIPNVEDIRDFVLRDMDREQVTKIWCAYNQKQHAVIWGYCQSGSTEPDRYVEVALHDYSWTTGTLDRTVMAALRASDGAIFAVSPDGIVYEHEVGLDDDGSAMEAYITFGLYVLARGDKNADVFGFVPDCERQTGSLSLELFSKNRPNSEDNLDEVTVTLSDGGEDEDFRLEARHFGFTIRSNVVGGDFRLGIPSIDVQQAGDR